jgi:predicted O-methyltransferase YrrM
MDPTLPLAVDAYLERALLPADPALEATLAASASAGLPAIAVSPTHGALLALLAQSIGARRALEVGTLGGYSAIWLARALGPDGHLDTLEREPHHAAVARANLAQAGLADRVTVHEGVALDLLATLFPPYDLVFLDADKENNDAYFVHALRLTRPGGWILIDNVVRDGRILDIADPTPQVRGVQRLLAAVGAEPRVQATAIQTIGAKGHDGLLVARVR